MNEHILIVEDEEKLARFVELELLHEGYQVSKSSNGREALDAGAVDYITKPFAIEELLARIRVAIKLHRNFNKATVPEAEDGLLRWGHLTLNEKKHQVTYDNHQISLTNREFQMLKVLLENQDIVLTRDVLLERVCGYDYVGETNVVDVYIRFLRSKIDQVFQVKMIQTVRGVGYVIKSEE